VDRKLLLTGLVVWIVGIVVLVIGPGLLDQGNAKVSDALMRVRPTVSTPTELRVMTFDELPSRRQVARMIRRLTCEDAKVIAIDIAFEPDRGRQDTALRDALRAAGPVVLGAQHGEPNQQGEIEPLLFGQYAPGLGPHVTIGGNSWAPDDDDVYRAINPALANKDSRVPDKPDERAFPAFAYKVALAYDEANLPGGLDPENRSYIDFHGPPGTFSNLPTDTLLSGHCQQGSLTGKLVIIAPSGRVANGAFTFRVPTGRWMSAAELDANAISTMLRGSPLKRPNWFTSGALLLLAAVLPVLVLARWPPTPIKIVAGVVTLLVTALSGGLPDLTHIIHWPWTYAVATLVASAALTRGVRAIS
jgi:CHASE2 domain-containing sensor protein